MANQLATDLVHGGDREGAAELVAETVPLLSGRFASDRVRSTGLVEALRNPAAEQAYLHGEYSSENFGDTYSMPPSLMFERGAQAFKLVDSGRYPWAIIHSAWLRAMRWLREDPRYFAMMQRRGRVEYWDSTGYPRGCNPVDGPDGRHLSCPE